MLRLKRIFKIARIVETFFLFFWNRMNFRNALNSTWTSLCDWKIETVNFVVDSSGLYTILVTHLTTIIAHIHYHRSERWITWIFFLSFCPLIIESIFCCLHRFCWFCNGKTPANCMKWSSTDEFLMKVFFFLSDWIDHMIQFQCEFQLLPSEINLNHLHVKRLTDQIKLQMTHIFNELSRLSVPYQWSGFHFVSFQSDKRRHFFMRNLIYYCEWNGFDFFWFDFGTTVSHSFNGINLFGKMSRID